MNYKPGDHYPDWPSLKPFPEGWRGSKDGDLVVYVGPAGVHSERIQGRVYVVRNQDSSAPWIEGGEGRCGTCPNSYDTAPLPTEIQKPSSASIFSFFSMSDLITKLKTALKGEPSKTLIAAGVETMDGALTPDGIKLVDDSIREEWYTKNKDALAEEIRALEKEEKKK